MYKEYLRETYNKLTLENEFGFVIYTIDKDIIYIEDMWIRPHFRGMGYGKQFLNYLSDYGKQKGCTKLMISVVLSSTNSNINLAKYILNLGFEITRANDLIIYLMKGL